MARITILGGTGYAGAAVVAEAAKRGHQVTSVSRSEPETRVDGVEYVVGSALDGATLDAVLPGRDVVISAISPRGDMADKLSGAVDELVARLAGTPTRFGFVGGVVPCDRHDLLVPLLRDNTLLRRSFTLSRQRIKARR